MHELSIITNILDVVEEQARLGGAKVINTIEIEVGELAGVEIPSLEFCFEAARKNTLAAGAELVIHVIPGRGDCPACGKDVAIPYFIATCPECEAGVVEVRQGRELRIKSINVD